MARYLLISFIITMFFACDTKSNVTKAKPIQVDNTVVFRRSFKSAKAYTDSYFSYFKHTNKAGLRFDYHHDSILRVFIDSIQIMKHTNVDGFMMSIYNSNNLDTVFLDQVMDDNSRSWDNSYSKYLFVDSFNVSINNEQLTIYRYENLDNDPRWDEDFFVSPKYGMLFIHYYYFKSTYELIKHPEFSKKQLEEIMNTIKKRFKSSSS